MIFNPILRGFNPDPSICCDSERYFIVTSTFEYFPSCAVYESTDLSCWTFHSYALRDEKLLDLTGCENSRGTWAATIRFNRGRYYVITTNTVTGDNFIVWTDDIDSKAWNGPFVVRNGGIDPSLYFEDDWCFYCSNGIVDGVCGILGARINPDTGELLEEARLLTEGITQHATEAPHIFKRGEWYYLIVAEGGTGFGHHENVLRSKSIYGPYECGPRNPVLGHIRRKGHHIQCLGHADLIDIGDDRWIAVFLGVRVYDRALNFNLGRETFMAEVIWDNDGWPMIGNNGFVDDEMPSDAVNMKKDRSLHFFDFTKPLEEQNTESLRGWKHVSYYQDTKAGSLTLSGGCNICSEKAKPVLLLMRQEEMEEVFSAVLLCDDSLDGKAGIVAWLTNHYNMILRVERGSGGRICYSVERNVHDLSVVVASGTLPPRRSVTLSVRTDLERYHIILDGMELASALMCNFSSNATMNMNFTGTMFGIFAEEGSATFITEESSGTVKVPLKEVVDAISFLTDDSQNYFDTLSGEIILVSDDVYGSDEDIGKEEIESDEARFIPLPSRWDINGYRIMEDFIAGLDDQRVQSRLASAIRGRGAFSRFRDNVARLGLLDAWYCFQEEALTEKAIQWCRENDLDWE